MSGYLVAGLSAQERLGAHPDTCAICSHEALKHPVKLAGPEGVIWAGEGCAANLLYGRTDRTAKTLARRAAREATASTIEDDRKAQHAAHTAEMAAFDAWCHATHGVSANDRHKVPGTTPFAIYKEWKAA